MSASTDGVSASMDGISASLDGVSASTDGMSASADAQRESFNSVLSRVRYGRDFKENIQDNVKMAETRPLGSVLTAAGRHARSHSRFCPLLRLVGNFNGVPP